MDCWRLFERKDYFSYTSTKWEPFQITIMYMSCVAHNSRKECDQMIQSHTNQASKPRSPLSASLLLSRRKKARDTDRHVR